MRIVIVGLAERRIANMWPCTAAPLSKRGVISR